jgi:hypothetical protein
MENPKPKTDEEWLLESADSPHLTKIKLSILGQIALAKLHPELVKTTTETTSI